MRVFITGATGFIGTHLVERMARTGHQMCCLVRQSSKIDRLKELGVRLVVGDVTDKESLLAGMAGCDWVANLANIYTLWEPDRRAYTRVNTEGTRNVLECALATGASKVLHVSTYGIWDRTTVSPITEETPVGPVHASEYTRTKHAGELAAWELYAQRGLPLVVIYPGNVVGPGDDKATGQYIRNLLDRRLPGIPCADTVYTFVHVRDVAEAIVRALEKEGNIGEKYLVAGYPLSMGELSRMVRDISGVALPRMGMPAPLTMALAAPLNAWASLSKQAPPWGLSLDQARILCHSMRADGSKAERELGIAYTPIRTAIEEAIAVLGQGA